MQLWFKLTTLGIFSAIGLSLAIVIALPEPPPKETVQAERAPSNDSEEAKLTAPKPAAPVEEKPEPAQPTVPVAMMTQPNIAALQLEERRALIDEAASRWTATFLPPVARQFDALEQTLKAAQKVEERTQALVEQAEKISQEVRNRQELPPSRKSGSNRDDVAEAVDSRPVPEVITAQVPEVNMNASNELVTINALGSDIREVFKALSEAAGINILATPSVNGTVSLSLSQVDVQTALNAILKTSGFASVREKQFLYVGTVEELQKMAVAGDKIATRVYHPNYVSAAELQKLITSMLSPDVGMISVSTVPEVGITSSKDNVGGDAYAGPDVVVVRDFESVLRSIDQVYEEVDRMPMQVSIEATILSVRLDDQNVLGVNFELLRNKDNIRIVSGNSTNSLANLNFAEGLKIGFLDESLFVFIQALETIGDTNVVASPRVMCLNKQRAEILIGSELGYVSTTITETASTQAVEFLEVGTHLKIRPFISNDGNIRLEVHPELSTGIVRVQGGFTLPDKDVTQVTTNVMCPNGATVVLGGLIREDLITSAQQIPVLGNLPLLGPLFRTRTEDTERREIIVLLTPRIVDEAEMIASGQHGATQFRDRRNAFFDKMSPINKRRVGERYGRLALSAWSAGDADAALRYANLAIHWDPLHQDAVDLRQEILAAYPNMERGVHDHLRYGLPLWERPLVDYSAETGFPWRDNEPVPAQKLAPVVNAGTPGPVREIITDAND